MVRNLKIRDIDEIMNIWLETNIKAHKFIDKSYWEDNFENVRNDILNAEVYVYEKEKQIVGFVGILDGYIAGIFVKDNMQRNGIGKSLINECKKKYKKLNLNVYEKNEKAIRFYQKENFYIVDKALDEQTNEIEVLMEWVE